MIFCRECGAKAPDDAIFCGSCGKPLSTFAREQTSISQPLASTAQASQDDGKESNYVTPLMPAPGVPSTGDVPVVQGTPQVGSVPSVPASVASLPVKAGMSAFVKVLIVAASCAVIVAGSVKVIPILVKGGNNTQGGASQAGKHPILTTVPMPATQTSCPTPGPARAAVERPLALGSNDNVVYVKTIKNANNTPVSTTLYRYDVKTGKTTQIFQVANVGIVDAQVSADGRWVVFTSAVGGIPAIQMVRMDGQGLQTLYCEPPTQYSYEQVILYILLSPDQQRLAFESGIDQNQNTFSLLNLTDGTLQQALQPGQNFTFYEPVMWLNNTQLYLWRYPIMQSALFLMNIQNGPNQSSNELTSVADFPTLTTLDISRDRTQLFTALCEVCGQGIFVGPSSIWVQPATGATRHLIYTAPKGAIYALLAAPDGKTLFFTLESYSEDPTRPADPSVDGVWKINLDGTGLVHVTGNFTLALSDHRDFSNDGKWYILSSTTGLFVASFNGGAPVQLASASDATRTSLVAAGWTRM